jgi:hypothetical protein
MPARSVAIPPPGLLDVIEHVIASVRRIRRRAGSDKGTTPRPVHSARSMIGGSSRARGGKRV